MVIGKVIFDEINSSINCPFLKGTNIWSMEEQFSLFVSKNILEGFYIEIKMY
jgi:hypothetical protein